MTLGICDSIAVHAIIPVSATLHARFARGSCQYTSLQESMMTLETAKAILKTTRREVSPRSHADPSYTDQAAFEARMERLRPRRFLRIPTPSV